MTATVFIDGAVGTTGLDIRERLAGRADLSLAVLEEDRRKDPAARAEALNDADLVILCLPDDAAREAVSLIRNGRTRVIDASTAHRVADGWTFGFPELEADAADRIRAAVRVANPGCWSTAFLALVRPLVRDGIVPADWPLTCNGVSGYSGGGKSLIERFEADGAIAYRGYAYGLDHKHVPEMQRHGGLAHPPLFAPGVVNAMRGMVVEVPLPLALLPGAPGRAALLDSLARAYDGSPLVRVADAVPGELLLRADAAPLDGLDLYVCADGHGRQARLVATLNNLGKGAGGAAVQNLNLMTGADPLAGLSVQEPRP